MRLIEFQQQKEIPDYLKQKSGIASQVLFSTIFALLFINIYKPFASETWGNNVQTLEYFLWSCGAVFVGFVVTVISRILLFHYAKLHRMFYWVYAVWIFSEVSAMAIIYTLIVKFLMPETAQIQDGSQIVDFFWSAFFTISFVLLIPTMLSWLYLALTKKKKDLEALQKQYQDTPPQFLFDQPSVIQFSDEKGETRFSVKSEHVIWIEAADNYVIIKYQNQGKISDFLLRNSLKHLEDNLKNTTLFRCHRSYMVNFDHAVALRKGQDGLIIELDVQPIKVIPVSKTYKEETTIAFTQYACKR